jgi:nicotinamidase-related amidase
MKRALLVIDVQNEYFTGRLPITHPAGSLENILKAMDLASERSIPVVIVQHGSPKENSPTFGRGTPGWELHPEVARRPRDLLFHKRLPGSFTGTDLDEWLRGQGVDTVAISGYMTHMCCDSTARQAFHRGFSVEFLSDATGTLALKNEGGEVTADELYRATLVAQAMVFSRVLRTGEWQGRLD